MDRDLLERARRAVAATRRPPEACGTGTACDLQRGDAAGPPSADPPPTEIWAGTGRSEASAAPWLHSPAFWALVQRWGDHAVLLGVSVSAEVCPDEATWQRIELVRRHASAWTIVLRIDEAGAAGMAVIDRALAGPFDEVQFTTGAPALHDPAGREPSGLNGRALAAIKQLVELRNARRQQRPRVTWLHRDGPDGSIGRSMTSQARAIARQIGVDRFEVMTSSH
jgi:hypothetical protein